MNGRERERFRRKVRQLEGKLADYERQLAHTVHDWTDRMTAAQIVKLPDNVRAILDLPKSERSQARQQALIEAYGKTKPDYSILKRSIAAIRSTKKHLAPSWC